MSDSKNTPLTDEELINAAKSTLDGKALAVDDDVRGRLQHARRVAVRAAAEALEPPAKSAPGWLMPAGGIAALTLVIVVSFYQLQTKQERTPMASIEDMPLLTAPEDLELYEELDFYQWLAEEHGDVG
jgi:hypothetical protein